MVVHIPSNGSQCSRRDLSQESGLDACIGFDRGIPRALAGRRWLDVVLAVQPEPLDNFERVLLVLIYVRMRGFEESG